MDKETINDRVKKLRGALGITQTEFGIPLEAAQTYVSQIEKGERPVTDKIFKLICLQPWKGKYVNEEWLRHGTGNMFILNTVESETDQYVARLLRDKKTPFSFLIKEIMHTYNELDSKSQEAFNSFLSKLIFNLASSIVDNTPPMAAEDESEFWSGLATVDNEYWENHNVAAANGNVAEKEFIDISGVRKAIDNDED